MMGRIIKLAAVAAVLAVLYIFFQPQADQVLALAQDRWNILRRNTAEAQVAQGGVSQRTAEVAEDKIARLRDGSRRESFTTNELQSLLEFRYRQMIPDYVHSPRITLEQDKIAIALRLPADRLPRIGELGQMLALLPDTTDIEILGTLLPSDEGHVAFTVDAITAHRIPIPARLVPTVLDMFGREDVPGLPADALRIPLPVGARSAYIRADSLVILAAGER
ncbi:MAG TPA: hypothetical protein VMM79_00505 [Longimicrobiales bacterium]|nr:hypothetical protein [Longimicrobiales bacterium]